MRERGEVCLVSVSELAGCSDTCPDSVPNSGVPFRCLHNKSVLVILGDKKKVNLENKNKLQKKHTFPLRRNSGIYDVYLIFF